MSRAVVTINSDEDRAKVARWAHQTNIGTVVEFRKKSRSTEQNAKMWSMLAEVSAQVEWYGQKLDADDWKDIFTAALRNARVVPGIDKGSFVPLGMRTSNMTIDEMGDLIELVYAFGADLAHPVVFKDPQSDDAPSLPSSGSDEPHSSSPEASDRSADPDASTNSNTGENPAPVSGEPTQSENPPPVSETTVPGSPAPFRFDAKERDYLIEFCFKALKQADDTTLGEAGRLFDLETMEHGYRGKAITSEDGLKALDAALVAIKVVISGDRTKERAAAYIARELLDCDQSELEGRR